MGVYIKNWSLADWKELLKWAKIGANNAMIGEFSEVEELPPHGRLIDVDELKSWVENYFEMNRYYHPYSKSTNIPAEELYDILAQVPAVVEAEVDG